MDLLRDDPARGPRFVSLSDEQLRAQCSVERTRRSGPGGQHRNKVETAIVLTHVPTGLRTEASASRSQSENLSTALRRLRLELALEVRGPADDGPSQLWASRCTGGRVVISTGHADFPALLAEALDVVAAHGFDIAAAGKVLEASSTQLVRFLAQEPRALAHVNRERRARQLRPLRA